MRALLVEDDKFFQHFYSTKLRERDIEVEVASDGEEGIMKMKSFSPNIVFLDLIMPKKDGFEVLTERSVDSNLLKIPVIVFSTLGQEKDIENARRLGANDYVNKSFFNFEEIMTKINKYASNYTTQTSSSEGLI